MSGTPDTMSPLERQFHQAMIGVYHNAKARAGYNATYFLRMVGEQGGLVAAKTLLASTKVQTGLFELSIAGYLDISMESVVLQPEYRSLFSEQERTVARKRLEQFARGRKAE